MHQTWGRAGILAGELVSRSALPRGEGHERRFLNDALTYPQAGVVGASVLTGNVRDFDCLGQLIQASALPAIGVTNRDAATTDSKVKPESAV